MRLDARGSRFEGSRLEAWRLGAQDSRLEAGGWGLQAGVWRLEAQAAGWRLRAGGSRL